MSWKKFREIFARGEKNESHFILGIDLGNATSSLAYFDIMRNVSETVDISGGYGKPSVPTVMQFVNETREWVFGEYAVTNATNEKDKLFYSMIERLGNGEYVEANGKTVPLTKVLSIYLKELIGNIKNINPKAEIAGIVASVPSYLTDEAKTELHDIFRMAGYDKPLLKFSDDRECILNRYYFDKKDNIKNEKALIIDFGSRELRAGIYDIIPDKHSAEGRININCLSFYFDKKIGVKQVDKKVTELFSELYCENTGTIKTSLSKEQIEAIEIFSYQHKDFIFQKSNVPGKPIKLYYNFTYPPFSANVTYEKVEKIISPLKHNIELFINEVFAKAPVSLPAIVHSMTFKDIKTVICVGGGFEMLFARQQIERMFPDSKIVLYKNSKGVIAEGASIICAKELQAAQSGSFFIKDDSRLPYDIGVRVRRDKAERFIPICMRNSFWWQEHGKKSVILMEPTPKNPLNDPTIELFLRDALGNIKSLKNIRIGGLPERPPGTTKISLAFEFIRSDCFTVTVKDLGFGEMFPASEFEKVFEIVV